MKLGDLIRQCRKYCNDEITLHTFAGTVSKFFSIPHRQKHEGKSNYSHKDIQPWDIWDEYDLDPYEADMVKRILRTKEGDSRLLDWKKMRHICDKKISILTVDMPESSAGAAVSRLERLVGEVSAEVAKAKHLMQGSTGVVVDDVMQQSISAISDALHILTANNDVIANQGVTNVLSNSKVSIVRSTDDST